MPKASRVRVERARSSRNLRTANGTSQATTVAPLQVDRFMENIEPYVLPSTPNVLSIGRRCRHGGYGFYWPPFAKTPEVIAPDGSEIPVKVFGDTPYFRDDINLSLREEHRGEDAVPVPRLEGNLLRGAARYHDGLASPVAPGADDPVEDVPDEPGHNEEADVAEDPNLAEIGRGRR